MLIEHECTITFEDGTTIHLTQEQFEKLRNHFREVVYIPPPTPYIPNPILPYPTVPPYTITWQKSTDTDTTATLKED